MTRISNGQLVKEPDSPAEQQRMRDNFAQIVASRRPPGTQATDQFLWAGRCNNHGIEGPDWLRKKTIDRAKRAGISIAGKVYFPTFGGPESPEAWVSDTSDIRQMCKKQNRPCDALGIKAREVEPTADVPLAEDLVQETMQEYLQRDPGRAKDLGGLREEIVEKHGAAAPKKHKGRRKAK